MKIAFKILLFFLFTSSLVAQNIFTIDKVTVEYAKKEYGDSAAQNLKKLVDLLNTLNKATETEQINAINDFFNHVTYESDQKVWHQKDYWASRIEFLDNEAGDCEDYVIAKYFSLRQLGIPDDRIFLTYVKAIKYRQSHMVLTYYETKNSVPLVLDNINKEIFPATKRTDLRPIFSFNGEKIYMAKQRGLGRVIPQGKINLTKWTNLILKIKKEKR